MSSEQSSKQTMSEPDPKQTSTEQDRKQTMPEQDQTLKKTIPILFPKFLPPSPDMTTERGPAEEVLLKHLKDVNVKTIVLTGEAGVGKTRMANEINNWALHEDGFCLGTLWVFPSPGDKHNWKSYWLSIAHQLSILSTTEEWEDHSTVNDENITVDGEKKASEETEKLRDDIIDEKEEKEDSMKKKISAKLEKMINDEKKKRAEIMKSVNSEKEIEEKIYEKIYEKTEMWLLILDGVPEEKDENEMMKNLNGLLTGKKGVFKFLITTTKKVIETKTESDKKVFKIEPLSEDDSLFLLNEKVKGKVRDHPDFETISKEVAKRKEGRLPAVILMMAEALNHIKEDDFDSGVRMLKGALEEPAGVNPLLGYVYDMLACTDMALINCCWQSKQLFQNFGGINYEELIACWILEGYVGVNDQFDKAYEEGHCVLMELIDRCILKLREDGLVTMEGLALTVPDEHCHGCRTSSLGLACVPDDHCHGRGTSRLGLARILEYGKELGIGRVAPGESMIKTPYGPKSWNKVSTLMIDGSRLSGDVLDTMFFQPMEELKVLAIFNPRFKSLPSFLFPKTKTDEPSSKPKTDNPIPNPKADDPSTKTKTGLRLLVLRGCDQLDNIDQIKNLEDLIVLEISGASSLEEIPDDFFQNMKQLESLNLSGVPVQSLPSSLSKLTKLRRLILKECSKLEELPNIKAFTDLEVVDLSGSTSLKTIKDKCLKQLQKLQMLDLSQTQINHLPILKDLKALTRLILKNCKSITRLSRFELLSSLHNLGLSGSTILKQIHDDSFKKKDGLKVLDLSESGICSLPPSFTHLPTLESLDLSGVSNLVKIPENTFVGMTCLRSLNLSNTKIEELPSSISKLGNLRQLLLSNCPLKKLPETRGLTRLEKLDLSNATSLVKFEDGSFDHLTNLSYLNFSNTQIKSLPSIANLKKLCQLLLQNCEHLSELPSLDALEQLEELDLSVKETENKSSQSSREPLVEPLKETETKSPVKETEKKPSDSSGPSTEPLKETEAKSPVKETEKKPSESSGEPMAEPLKETEAKSPVKETEKKPSESSGEPMAEPLKETEAKSPVKETEKKPSESSGEPSAPVKETEKKPSESSGEPSAEHLKETEAAKSPAKETEKKSSESSREPSKETEAAKSPAKETEKKSSESSREPSKETEAKLSVKETEKKSSGSSREPLAEPLKEVEAKFLEKMVHLRLLNLSGTKLKIKIPQMSNLTSLTNLTELCLGGCKLSDTDPSLETYTKLKVLDLSKTEIQSLKSLKNLTNLRGLKLRGCTKLQQLPDLESFKDLESLDLQETGVKEFPYWISELTHLKHLDLPDLKDLRSLDWERIKNLPEELNWDHCGIFKFNENRPCMSLSGTQFFQYLKENSGLWKTYFEEFKFSVCAITKEGKDSRTEKKKDKASIQQKKENKVSSPENKDDKASSQEKKEDTASSREKKQDKSSSQEKKEDKASSREKKQDKTSSQEKKEDKASSQEKKEDKASGQEKKENKASEQEKKDNKTSSEEKKKEDKTSSAEKKEDKASCKEKKEDESRDICWHRVDSNFRKIYFKTHSFPENISKYLEIIGFDEYPGGVEDVLMKAEYVSLIENDFVKSLSNLGVGNLKAMKGCWLERCNEMTTIFFREEAEVEMQKNLNILWASNLPELKSVYSGEMQHGSLLNLTELYLDCCPMLEIVFPSSQLPENLKILEVKFCDELKTLFMPTKVEEYEQRNLQKLHLVELPKLTSIGVLEGSNNKKRFPSLEVIKVRECPNLQHYGTVLELGGSVENSKIEEY